MTYRIALVGTATFFAIFGAAPLLATYGEAVWGRAGDLVALASSLSIWAGLGRSVLLATLSVAGAMLLAAPLAFFTGRVQSRGRAVIATSALVPLAFPPYSLAVALGPWLPSSPLLASSIVLSLALYPIPFVCLRAALASVDPDLEEAGLVARGTLATLGRVTWPLVRPWAVASAGVVFLLGMGELGATSFLGLPVYASQIALRFAATYDAAGAAVAALPLLAAVLLVLAAELAALRRVDFVSVPFRPARRFDLAGWNIPLRAFAVAVVAFSPGLPFVVTILEVDAKGWSRGVSMAMDPMFHSVLVAGAGASVALIVGLVLALLTRRGVRVFRAVSLTFFVIPGTVLGIGLIGFWNRPTLPPVYGSVALLVAALVLRYTVVAERTIGAGLVSVPAVQEQVARLAGRSETSILRRVLCPQIAASLLAGVVVFLLFVLRDLDTVVAIYPPGGETLTVRLYTVAANAPRGLRAALSLMQMALALPVVLLLAFTSRSTRWRL